MIGTSAENTYIPGELFVNNVAITGSSTLLTKPTLYSTIFSNILLSTYDSIKMVSFIDLAEGVYMIKFVLQMTSDNALPQIGCLEYGLSYVKISCTLSKNRQEIKTRSEFNINTGIVNIDSSEPYIFHEYLVRTYDVTTNLSLKKSLKFYKFQNNTIVPCCKSNRISMSDQKSVHSIENGN